VKLPHLNIIYSDSDMVTVKLLKYIVLIFYLSYMNQLLRSASRLY